MIVTLIACLDAEHLCLWKSCAPFTPTRYEMLRSAADSHPLIDRKSPAHQLRPQRLGISIVEQDIAVIEQI